MHISTEMVDNFEPVIFDDNEDNESRVAKLIDLKCRLAHIHELGWYEHTEDWDLSLTVKLKSNATIETGRGYTDINIVGYKPNDTCSSDGISEILFFTAEGEIITVPIDELSSILLNT